MGREKKDPVKVFKILTFNKKVVINQSCHDRKDFWLEVDK